MDLINALLGFIVLTSPLWLILLFLIIGVWAAFKVRKRFKSGGAKWAASVGVLVLAFLVLFGDELAGRAYLNYLCATKAGVKVYHTVELPAEYWNSEGEPKFLGHEGLVDMKPLPDKFGWRKKSEPYLNSIIKIEEWRWQLIDEETETVLGEKVLYMRYFGWLSSYSPAPNIGESCRNLGKKSNRAELTRQKKAKEQSLFRKVFKPATIR